MSDLQAIVLASMAGLAVGYFAFGARPRRFPREREMRLPTHTTPSAWHDLVDQGAPLARRRKGEGHERERPDLYGERPRFYEQDPARLTPSAPA